MEYKSEEGAREKGAMAGPEVASSPVPEDKADGSIGMDGVLASGESEELRLALQAEILERRRAEQVVSVERQRQRDLLDVMPGLVLVRAADNIIVFANKCVRERLGSDPEGLRCREILKDCRGECDVCMPVGEVVAKRDWVLSTGGSVFQMSSYPFSGCDGSSLVLDIGIDVTARIRAEEGVRVYSRKLELCRRELREFATAVSRGLQEPAEYIIDLCGQILGEPHGDPVQAVSISRDGLGRVETTARRMSALASSLLSYLDLTDQIEPFSPADLGRIASDAVHDLEPLITRRKGSVEVGELPMVEADPGQMRLLFRSLVGTILRQEGETGPRIRIEGQRCNREQDRAGAEAPSQVQVHVHVQGEATVPWSSDGRASRVLSTFERLGDLLAGGGPGMGLAVCRRIVERHGGTIAAWRMPGGSRYTFILPERQRGMAVKTI